MYREQARQEALRRATRRKKGRVGVNKPTRGMELPERSRMTTGQRERLSEMERRRRILAERKRQEMMMQARPGMLTGGQAKLDKNKNGRIDAQDFKILKAEKAKGRGQGLQDEKMKPGRVMKADKGGMGDATKYKKYLKGLKDVKEKAENKKFEARRMRLAGGRAAMNAIKASRVGKIAAGVAGAALLGKAALEKMYEKRTGKKPFTKRPEKKMGGGMMMQRPIKAVGGAAISAIAAGAGAIGAAALRANKKIADRAKEKKKKSEENVKKKMGGGMMMRRPMMAKKGEMIGGISKTLIGRKDKKRMTAKEFEKIGRNLNAANLTKTEGSFMGGGMMMRPNPVGYKTGKSVKVKCKLGRNKPTKMY